MSTSRPVEGEERELWLAREVARRLWDPDWPAEAADEEEGGL